MIHTTALDAAQLGADVRPTSPPPGFVRVHGEQIVDDGGNPLLLRGVGLGNWLLPEGYMWGFGDAAASPRQIEALVVTLVGEESATVFWQEFRRRFVTQADISLIASVGFDHVRLPINWRVLMTPDGAWLEEGFACVDRLIGWCRDAGLWVLLDLHGAPGGQTGTNIDDSLGKPELFMDERNVDLTVSLWTEIATRYRDESTVLGYDLLNEPLPDEWQHRYGDDLVDLYRRLTAAIREVDPHHLIMYEGMHWATNWEIFTEVWDPNSVLQFHKYWSPADRPSIEQFISAGRALGLPIYMGEGGENTPEWLAAAFQLYEDAGIGWNFWPWKKIETLSSPCSITPPQGWDRVVAFASGAGDPPSRSEARSILIALLGAMDVAACVWRPEVVHSLLRRAPLRLPAYGFSFQGAGASYRTARAEPHAGLRADDAVTLRRRDHGHQLDFHYPAVQDEGATIVAELQAGDWLSFDVELPAGEWQLVVHTDGSAEHTGHPSVSVAGVPVPVAPWSSSDLVNAPADRPWAGVVEQQVIDRVAVRVGAEGGPLVLSALDVREARP